MSPGQIEEDVPEFLKRPQPKETDMARPKGSKNKAKDESQKPASTDEAERDMKEAAPNGSIGHNKPPPDLTEDEKQRLAHSWLRQFEPSLATKNKAASEHSNMCKRMKTEITWVDDPTKLMKEMIGARTEEGEGKLRAAMERKLAAARYMAVPLGQQFEMFPDRMPAEERAFAEGKRDAMAGEPLRNDYDPSVPQFARYTDGWHAGQTIVTEAQRARDAQVFDGVTSEEEAAALAAIEKDGIGATVAAELH